VGFSWGRIRFGTTESDALARVERAVQAHIDRTASTLQEIAADVAREPRLFDAAAADPVGSQAHLLFDRADQSLDDRTSGVFAVSAYRPSGSGTPLAWSGRPSEIDLARLGEGETFFVESVALGLRLVYVRPVTDSTTGHRLGVVASECVLSASRGLRTPSAEATLSVPSVVPVIVRPHDARYTAGPNSFLIRAPGGEPLLDARVPSGTLTDARARWRANVGGAVLAMLAFTLIISVAPLLRWRRSVPSRTEQFGILAGVVAVLLVARGLIWLAPVPTWTVQVFDTAALAAPLRVLLRSPLDFVTTMLLLAVFVILGFDVA
jgi:hypothetical protein